MLANRLRAPRVLAKTSESPFDIGKWVNRSEQTLLSRQHRPYPRADDRERITRARQAAEALFSAKPPVSRPLVPDTPPADQSARKPRVLGFVPSAPVGVEEVKPPVRPEQQMPGAIPRSQFARIRALVKYGMTVAQVAAVYGIAVGDVERILRNA